MLLCACGGEREEAAGREEVRECVCVHPSKVGGGAVMTLEADQRRLMHKPNGLCNKRNARRHL